MLHHVTGELCHREPGIAVIDCGGVGYKLSISMNTASAIDAASEAEKKKMRLLTHMIVREDGIELYGFYTAAELSAFKLLITVSGVGPKAAMSIMSTMKPESFALAVCSESTKLLSKAPGVGAKTAARIVLELKDKLSRETAELKGSELYQASSGTSAEQRNKLSEAQDALAVLGYGRAEINAVLGGIDVSSLELEDIIRTALKKFMKG